MTRIQRDAFVVSPQMHEHAQRLNRAVLDCELLFVLAPSGSGKDRFFDWWWQEGCSQPTIVGERTIDPNEVVVISLVPPPSGSVPPACVLFTKLWHGLQELDRARAIGQRVRPTGKPRSWFTEQQSLELIYKYVHPLIDELDPSAVVVLNGEYSDKRCWPYLTELRSPIQRNKPLIAQRAPIVCASVEPTTGGDSKFGKLVNDMKELRPYWPNRLAIGLMDVAEFVEVMVALVRRNLNAVFAEGVDQDEILREAAEWTQAEWRLTTTQLIPIIDEELGAAKGDAPRIVTKMVWGRVRDRWKKRQW